MSAAVALWSALFACLTALHASGSGLILVIGIVATAAGIVSGSEIRPGSLRARFLEFDDALAAHGVPPCSSWWRANLGAWLDAYETGHVLELWACVGRGAAKSTALYKLATFFTLFGDFVVPPGERHFAIVLSRLKEEAGKGIDIIHRWLGLLGVAHRLAGDVIELVDMPRGIRVVAASVAGASGWRAYFVAKDERSKWPASGVEEREGEEIDTSATAMTATHAFAPVLSFGSAWGAFGSFYDAVMGGTDAAKFVLGPAPTWVAAPHITEESTRRKERDPSKWAREYACVFQESTEASLYPVSLIDRACRKEPGDIGPEHGSEFVAAMDPSLGRNAWTLTIAGRREVDGQTKASIFLAREWRAPSGGHFDMVAMLVEIAGLVVPYTRVLLTDQFHGETLAAITDRLGIGVELEVDKPTSAERLERYESLLARLSDDEIELPYDRRLRADMISVKRKFTANGFTIHLPQTGDGRHADYAAAATLALSRARYEAASSWVKAMQSWRAQGCPNLWGGFDPSSLYQRTRVPEPLKVYHLNTGFDQAVGNAPPFTDSMTARWRPRHPDIEWSASATPAFRDAVEAHRTRTGT